MSVNAVSGTTYSAAQAEAKKSALIDNEPVSIMEFDAGKANKTIDVDLVSTDGKSDGKLSAKEIAKLAVKGAGEDVKDGLLSPLGIIGMVGVTALSLCPATAPFVLAYGAPLAVASAAVGIVGGIAKTISGVTKAVTAETDADAKSGVKQAGSGGFTTITSAATLKAGLNQMSKVEGSHMEAAYRDKTSKVKAYFQDVDDLTGNKFGSLISNVKNRFGGKTEVISEEPLALGDGGASERLALPPHIDDVPPTGGSPSGPSEPPSGGGPQGPNNPQTGGNGGAIEPNGGSGRVLNQSEIDALIEQMKGNSSDVLHVQPDTIFNADGSIAGIWDATTGYYYEPQAITAQATTTATAQTIQSSFPQLNGKSFGNTLTLPPAGATPLPSGNVPPSLTGGQTFQEAYTITLDPRLYTVLNAQSV